MRTKKCSVCKRNLPETEEFFYKQNSKFVSSCKKCRRKKQREYMYKDYDDFLDRQLQYQRNNKDKRHEYDKKYYIKRCNEVKKYRKQWAEDNTEKIREYSEQRRLHKSHSITKNEWNKCKEFFNNACAYCGMSYDEHKTVYKQDLHKEHVDHNGANDISNCVPSCKVCNSRKHIAGLYEWYVEGNPIYDELKLKKIEEWLSNFVNQ